MKVLIIYSVAAPSTEDVVENLEEYLDIAKGEYGQPVIQKSE